MQYKRLTASSSLLHNFQPIRKTNKSPTTGGRGLGLFEDWVFSFCYQETKLKMVSLNKNETKTGRKSSRGNAFLRSVRSSPPPTGSLRCRHRSCSRRPVPRTRATGRAPRSEVAVGMGPGTGKELQPAACPRGMCLSSPGGRPPSGTGGLGQKRAGERRVQSNSVSP